MSIGVIIDLQRGDLSCSELNFSFDLVLDPPGKGVPVGISLDDTTLIFLPLGVTSNISSRIQYTAMDAVLSSVFDSTPSNNLVVHDEFFQGSVSRTLSYTPFSNSTTSWQPRPKPLAHFKIRIREGDVAVEIKNSEHHRLNFTKLRSRDKLNIVLKILVLLIVVV